MPEPDTPNLEELRSLDDATHQSAWSRAYPILYTAGMKLAHVKLAGENRRSDREDLVAKAIIQCMHGVMGVKADGSEAHRPSFAALDGFNDLRNLFLAILRRRIADHYQKQEPTANAVEWDEALVGEGDFLLQGDRGNPLRSPDESAEAIWTLVDQLKPPKPKIFRLFFSAGHTADEIAAKLAMSRNTVLSHLYRGYKSLRKLLLRQP